MASRTPGAPASPASRSPAPPDDHWRSFDLPSRHQPLVSRTPPRVAELLAEETVVADRPASDIRQPDRPDRLVHVGREMAGDMRDRGRRSPDVVLDLGEADRRVELVEMLDLGERRIAEHKLR